MKVRKLYIDQYGDIIYASSVKELREKCFGGKVSKMYYDTKDGVTKHIGYVVGRRWLTCYIPFEK